MDIVLIIEHMSSRAIGEGSAVEGFKSSDRLVFPLVPWFRSLPRASYFSFLVKRKGKAASKLKRNTPFP
jgi:hypothetical protein